MLLLLPLLLLPAAAEPEQGSTPPLTPGPTPHPLLSSPFAVLKVVPESEGQLSFLRELWAHAALHDVDFWQPPTHLGKDIHIMVGPGAADSFAGLLTSANLTAHTMIRDVQR